jgi:hypothetical protein
MPRLANKVARKGLAKLVNTIVRRQQETKYVSQYLQVPDASSILKPPSSGIGLTTFTSAITGPGELYSCIPQLTLGSGSYQRVGATVNPVGCRVDMMINAGGYQNLNTYDITVHIFVISHKSVKTAMNYSAVPITDLFMQGNGSDAPFDGTIQNTILPINKEAYVLHKHMAIRMNKSDGQTNGGLDSSGVPNRPTVGGVTGLIYRSVKVPLPKTLLYNNDTQTYPTNAAPFLCLGFVRNDDAGTTAPNQRVPGVIARAHLWYKDS